MKNTKFILLLANKLKPILLKIFPHSILRKLKRKVIYKSIGEMNNIKILPFDPLKYQIGVNLIGDIKAETGLGQSCRLVANEIKASEIDFSIYHYNQLGDYKAADNSWDKYIASELPYNVNLIHINPHELGLAYVQMNQSMWDYRYNIAFWLWELEEFPEEWVPCFSCLNEIWTPSEFISRSIRKKTDLPVKTIPYHVNVVIQKYYDRKYFGLKEDQFLFLTMYDSNSITERKNPMGTFEAFKKAFSNDNQEVGLVLKINNANKEDIKLIRENMKGYSNVYIITDILNKDEVNSLIKECDVLVSLHRAEGFGLVLAEAMLLGIPTIATNWSSNTEFMNPDVACMVDYKLIDLEKDMGPFKKGNRWAEPDIVEAAKYMEYLYQDKELYNDLANNAKIFIEDKLNINKISSLIRKRISEIENLNLR